MTPPPCSPSIIRRASLLPLPAPSSSRLDNLQTTSLSAALATRLPLALPSTPHLCVASERACVRNGGRGVWRAPQKRPRPLLPPPRQLPLLPGQKSIDVPLSGPKRQKSSEKGRARSTDNARRQWSPDPTDALAHRNSPRAGPRSLPSSAWIGFALLYCRLPEKGTKMKPWGAAMIKIKTMGLMPRLGAIQWCRLRRDLPSRSLAPAMGTKGGGLATAILNLDLT